MITSKKIKKIDSPKRINVINLGAFGTASEQIINDDASFRYRCPSVVLIVSRAQ